jgi:hypothetical protein
LASLRRFPNHACASRQRSLPQEYQCQRYAKRGYSAETIGYVATNTAGNTATSPFRRHRINNRGNHKRNFNSVACSALLGYLIVAVSQMEVLWPLAVSVGSPEVVSVMRPADFNSGMPFLTVLALPTLILN